MRFLNLLTEKADNEELSVNVVIDLSFHMRYILNDTFMLSFRACILRRVLQIKRIELVSTVVEDSEGLSEDSEVIDSSEGEVEYAMYLLYLSLLNFRLGR